MGGHFPASTGKWYMMQGGAVFDIRIHQSFNGTDYEVEGSFEDLHTGYYFLSYTPQRIGRWVVDIKMYGPAGLEHINGSPFHVDVKTGPTDPRGCRLIGDLGEGNDVIPMNQVMFRIQAGDAFANHQTMGGDEFVVKLDGPNPVAGIIKDIGDGTYNCSFTVTKAGTYTVFVGINYLDKYETAIYGSPFAIVVPKIQCDVPLGSPPGEECSGHGICEDHGSCTCEAAYDGQYCEDEINAPYRQAIIIENALIGGLIVIYGAYVLYTSQTKGKNRDDGLAMLDDDEDEEVQFHGLKCCMHW